MGKSGWPWTVDLDSPQRLFDDRSWPRLSVVTPSYNQGQFIEETIRSVLLQGYPNLEYIVIDGGSTDDSVEVIRKYEPWLSYWVSERDNGQADAINKGFGRATGQFLAWINSDDFYLPECFKTIVSQFGTDDSIGLVYGEMKLALGASTGPVRIGYPVGNGRMLDKLVLPFQPACFFRKSVLDKVGPLDVALRYVMDSDIILKVMSNSNYVRHPSALATFRVHRESKTSTADEKFAEELLMVLDKVLSDRDRYPALARFSEGKLRSLFYRRASKHYYMGDRFARSLQCIWAAIKSDPGSTLDIIRDVGARWMIRRVIPAWVYRTLGVSYRSLNVMGDE
jgi:glycosyltransferase involved in cell wall biosynthesis